MAEVKDLFKKSTSVEINKLTENVQKETNGADQGINVYNVLLNERIVKIQNWMIEVAKKAAIRYEELNKKCDEAAKIQPDFVQFNDQGVKNPTYTEKVWKEKNAPFKELEVLSAQIDLALTKGTEEEFKKLEKLLK